MNKQTNKKIKEKDFLETAAAAAAKLLQSCPTLCDPRDGSPPSSPVSGILQARILESVAIPFSRGLPHPGTKLASLVLESWSPNHRTSREFPSH